MTARNPTIADVVSQAVAEDRSQVRTLVPAQVVAYNPATATASVSSVRLSRDVKGIPIDPVVIPDRPVIWPRGGGYVISWDLLPGDTVALVCADREMDGFLYGAPGSPALPQRSRMHSLADAVVLPGLSRVTDPSPAPRVPGTMYIGSETGPSITISAAGVSLGAPVTTDAVVLANLLQAALLTIVTAAPTVQTDGGAAFKAGLLGGLAGLAAQVGATQVRAV